MTIVHTNRVTPVISSAAKSKSLPLDSEMRDDTGKAVKRSLLEKIRSAFKNRGKAAEAKFPDALKSTLTSVRGVEPTGTSIVNATRDDRSAPQPDFMQGSGDQSLTAEEYNEGMSAPPTGGVLNGVMGDGIAELARQGWQQLEEKEARTAQLKAERKEQREKSGQSLQRRSGTRSLIDHDKASAQAAANAEPRKTSGDASPPDEPPPSYAEAMGIPASPKPYTLKQLKELQARLAPTAGPSNPQDLLRLDPKNQAALLELTRNLAAKLQDAAPNSYLGKTLDILHAMIRELKGDRPEISRYAFNWLMARAKELVNYESVAVLQAKDASARKPELSFAVVRGEQGVAEKRSSKLQEALMNKFPAADFKLRN